MTKIKTFKYRLYPTKKQRLKLDNMLELCRWTYNHFLEQRKTLWEQSKQSTNAYAQMKELTQLKKEKVELTQVYTQTLYDAIIRLDSAYDGFFRRVKKGLKPGFPRFKGEGRYNSMAYPYSRLNLKNKKIYISKVGKVKIRYHRPIEGNITNYYIRRTNTGKWFLSITCNVEMEIPALPSNPTSVGIDLGIKSFATLSDGSKIDNPKFFKQSKKKLAKIQRQFAKAEKGTERRTKKRNALSRCHEKTANQRSDFAHKLAKELSTKYNIIAVENLKTNEMLKNTQIHNFNRSISDAAWVQFLDKLCYKAEWAGNKVVKVNPAFTSQDCSRCDFRQLMPLKIRTYNCPNCHLSINRDYNASINLKADHSAFSCFGNLNKVSQEMFGQFFYLI